MVRAHTSAVEDRGSSGATLSGCGSEMRVTRPYVADENDAIYTYSSNSTLIIVPTVDDRWFFRIALVACLLSFAVWRLRAPTGLVGRPLSVLETNCMQTTAPSAACATGHMVVGVFPAMLLLTVSPAAPAGIQPHWAAVAAW